MQPEQKGSRGKRQNHGRTEGLGGRQSEEGVTLIPEWKIKKVTLTQACTHARPHTHMYTHIWSIQFLLCIS